MGRRGVRRRDGPQRVATAVCVVASAPHPLARMGDRVDDGIRAFLPDRLADQGRRHTTGRLEHLS